MEHRATGTDSNGWPSIQPDQPAGPTRCSLAVTLDDHGAFSSPGAGTTATNTAPTVANPIDDQTATVGTALNYAFPANTFADADGDTLTYTATKSRRYARCPRG